MTPTTRRTLFSILILLGILGDLVGPALFHPVFPWDMFLPFLAIVATGMAAWLWIQGLREAGKGWHRSLFLAAFAAPIVWLGMGVSDFAHGAYDGFNEGYQQGVGMAAQERAEKGLPPRPPVPLPPNPVPVMPPLLQLVSWLALTVVFAKLLDLLERRGAETEHQKELTKEARSEALRGKLAPHFIFNALNTLHAQIEADPKGAEATTEKLAALFRQVLEVSDQATIPLRQELNFIEAYLGIEQARLGDRLRVFIEIPEDLEMASIPPLSLQVLVENAIRHGVNPLEPGGEVRIGAERREGALHLWVEDPGSGFSPLRGTGTALETLRQRLERPEDLEMGIVHGRHRVGFQWRQA